MNIENLLKSKKMIVTNNRIKIIQCLEKSIGNHFLSISEISNYIGKMNIKSIYNNIKQLINAGIVDSYSFGGISKYALNDNLLENKNEIHLIHNSKVIHHLYIKKSVFSSIEESIKESGHEVISIKIFVKVK